MHFPSSSLFTRRRAAIGWAWIFALLAALATLPRLAWAGGIEAAHAYEKEGGPGVPPEMIRYQNLKGQPDYSESWFLYAQDEAGGLLFVNMGVTDTGPQKWGALLNVSFLPPGETEWLEAHREYNRNQMKAAAEGFDTEIAGSRAWGQAPEYHLQIREKEIEADIDFHAELPACRYRDGRVRFGAGAAAWTSTQITPRARVSGVARARGKSHTLKGLGCIEHSWETVKMPSMADTIYYVRLWNGGLTLNMQETLAKPAYGGRRIQSGLLAENGKLTGQAGRFLLRPSDFRPTGGAPRDIPWRYDVLMKAGDTAVSGTLTVNKALASIDVLARLSWPVRMAVRAFYGRPWLFRLMADYRLELSKPGAAPRRLSGQTLITVARY